MNMLIIGNGFDLAHDRPTQYADFLDFLYQIERIKIFNGEIPDFEKQLFISNSEIEKYILSAFRTANRANGTNSNPIIQEIYDLIKDNSWYKYFQNIYRSNKMCGNGWIDFESEIKDVIKFVDKRTNNVYDEYNSFVLKHSEEYPKKMMQFHSALSFSEYNKRKNKKSNYSNTIYDFVEKTYEDLENLIRCLEIYLDDCVNKISFPKYSPDLSVPVFDMVLDFNYTSMPTTYRNFKHIHHIHGEARSTHCESFNNMVLGVDEYWDGYEKNFQTNFNCYKKFVQRILKETGIDYKRALERAALHSEQSVHHHACIFGHSLDITDGDILREIIGTPHMTTTVFYKDKQQQANQIANLGKILGQDELLKRTMSLMPSLIFKRQKDMVPITLDAGC